MRATFLSDEMKAALRGLALLKQNRYGNKRITVTAFVDESGDKPISKLAVERNAGYTTARYEMLGVVDAEGSFETDLNALSDIVKQFKSTVLVLEGDDSDMHLVVDDSKWRVEARKADEPVPSNQEIKAKVHLLSAVAGDMFRLALPVLDKNPDVDRKFKHYGTLEVKDGVMSVYATDSCHLIRLTDTGYDKGADLKCTIPYNTMLLMSKMIGKSSDVIELSLTDTHVKIRYDNLIITAVQEESATIDYPVVFEKFGEGINKIRVDADKLLEGAKKLNVLAAKKTYPSMRLETNDNTLKMFVMSEDVKDILGSVVIDAVVEGKTYCWSLNPKYLINLLKEHKGEEVTLSTNKNELQTRVTFDDAFRTTGLIAGVKSKR